MASLKVNSIACRQWPALVSASSNAVQSVAQYSSEAHAIKDPRLSSLRRGTGGRQSFSGVVATVFGASGFLGRYVCNRLGKTGTQMIIPYRGDEYDVLRLKQNGDLGQVLFTPYFLKDEASVRKALKHSNVVINLIGRDWETRNFSFEDVYVKGPQMIARLAKECGVEKLIHISALNAEEEPEGIILKNGSKFLATKWRGEQAVREEFPEAVIFRPSDMYGQEDRFLRYYAAFWRRQFKAIPLWKKGEQTFKQPVFISDVAQGIMNAIRDPDTAGKIYQAVGPKRYQLGELVDWFYRVMRKDKEWGYFRYDMRYDPLFQMKVTLTEKGRIGWPIASLGWERLERDHVTDRVDSSLPTLEDLGVTLTTMEDQVPWELAPLKALSYYDAELGEFEKPAPPPVATQ